jgi:hypothetical protein
MFLKAFLGEINLDVEKAIECVFQPLPSGLFRVFMGNTRHYSR